MVAVAVVALGVVVVAVVRGVVVVVSVVVRVTGRGITMAVTRRM